MKTTNALIKVSHKWVPQQSFEIKSTVVQLMAWPQAGDEPLLEPMMTTCKHNTDEYQYEYTKEFHVQFRPTF